MAAFDWNTMSKMIEAAGGWEKVLAHAPPIVEFRELLTASQSPRAMFAIKKGPGTQEWEDNIYLRGFNGGIEQAFTMLDKALKIAPTKPKPPRHEVSYASHFGPTRIQAIDDEGLWTFRTREDV